MYAPEVFSNLLYAPPLTASSQHLARPTPHQEVASDTIHPGPPSQEKAGAAVEASAGGGEVAAATATGRVAPIQAAGAGTASAAAAATAASASAAAASAAASAAAAAAGVGAPRIVHPLRPALDVRALSLWTDLYAGGATTGTSLFGPWGGPGQGELRLLRERILQQQLRQQEDKSSLAV